MAGYSARVKWDHRERISAAWHGAAFERSKKMPKLADVLGERKAKKKRAQTPQEMLGVMKALAAGCGKAA